MSRSVYFIRPVGMEGPIKIGISALPKQRCATLENWCPFPLEIAAQIPNVNKKLENQIQDCFAHAHSHGEWFRPVPELVEAVRRIAAGDQVGSVIDLARPTGIICDRRRSEKQKRVTSYTQRARHAARRSGEQIPARIVEILQTVRMRPLGEREKAEFDAYAAAGVRHLALNASQSCPDERAG